MSRWWRTNTCERATQWISLDLDGELSQLEQAALARHLLSCSRCQAVSAAVSSFTRILREAPLIELERECCAWIRFEVEGPVVTLTADAGGAAVLAGMFMLARVFVPSG